MAFLRNINIISPKYLSLKIYTPSGCFLDIFLENDLNSNLQTVRKNTKMCFFLHLCIKRVEFFKKFAENAKKKDAKKAGGVSVSYSMIHTVGFLQHFERHLKILFLIEGL